MCWTNKIPYRTHFIKPYLKSVLYQAKWTLVFFKNNSLKSIQVYKKIETLSLTWALKSMRCVKQHTSSSYQHTLLWGLDSWSQIELWNFGYSFSHFFFFFFHRKVNFFREGNYYWTEYSSGIIFLTLKINNA